MTAPAATSPPDEPAGVPSGWEPVRAPYLVLRGPLMHAEGLLNTGSASLALWRRLTDAVGDDDACCAAVNDLLANRVHGLRVLPNHGWWRVPLLPSPGVEGEEVAALQALVLLVEAGGWSRLQRCDRAGCKQLFLDGTNAGSRRVCRRRDRKRRRHGEQRQAARRDGVSPGPGRAQTVHRLRRDRARRTRTDAPPHAFLTRLPGDLRRGVRPGLRP